MTSIANYIIDIRNSNLEDVQTVANAIATEGDIDFKPIVGDIDLKEYETMLAYNPRFQGFQGLDFGDIDPILYREDPMTASWFFATTKRKLSGVLTVAEAIAKFDL